MENNKLSTFYNKLHEAIEEKQLVKLILSNKRDKNSDLKKIIIKIIELKNSYFLNFVYNHNTKDITKNYKFEEGINLIINILSEQFYNCNLFTNAEDIILNQFKNGKVILKSKENTSFVPLTIFNHDRTKNRIISTKNNIYLRELGVISEKWEVYNKMIDKYKQINRYIELLSPNLKEIELNEDTHIADMGSGKGYLTFALYDYLVNNLHYNVKMTGVEFRKELVDKCNEIAKKSNFSGLDFIEGTIEKAKIEKIDILIALHACDTATDEAIFRGIKSKASLIVCAPCCHKQIRREMNVTNELSQVVKHGILKERQAEIITDSLRALIMESKGYKTNVFEFISTEHTPKNLMIIGRKIDNFEKNLDEILETIDSIKKLYGIEKHYLENLLG